MFLKKLKFTGFTLTNFFQKKNLGGFTLLELLVVIAILGLLSTVAIAALSSAREKARDAKRLADLNQIRKALNLFYDDYQEYPWESNAHPSGTFVSFVGAGGWASTGEGGNGPNIEWETLEILLAPYISPLPKDPSYESCSTGTAAAFPKDDCYGYYYKSTNYGQEYDFVTKLEGPNHSERCENKPPRGWVAHINSVPGSVNGPRAAESWCPDSHDEIGESSLANRAAIYLDHP